MLRAFYIVCALFLLPLHGLQAEPILAATADQYYGPELTRQFLRGDLKSKLHQVLTSHHISQDGMADRIVESCDQDESDHCYAHRKLSYKKARQYMFGLLYLKDLQGQGYGIPTVYCQDNLTDQQFPEGQTLGPMQIPYSQIVNAEHAWPQSHFTGAYSKSLQKSDLHSLYPVKMRVNSTRSNHPFGEVEEIRSEPCDKAFLGKDHKGQTVFEPADSIKGNVARSLFYFSVRYHVGIDPDQEKILRLWHTEDPVDEEEFVKHEETFHIQFVRNPFIDHPEWVEKIHNF